MRYQISGKQIDIGEALQIHVKDRYDEMVEKYSFRPTDAYIVFSKSGHEFVCESVIHLSTGLICQSKDSSSEIYAAFDGSADKMEKQLRRYKRRLKDHHRDRAQPVESMSAGSYILASDSKDEADEPETVDAMIIAEMETKVPSLSVSEAVMQMELADDQVLVFKNEKHGGLNVVHRRADGNIGWIDPQS